MDIFDKTASVDFVNSLKAEDVYPYFRVFDSSIGTKVKYKDRNLLMLGSNNYLGLTHDPRVINATVDAVKKWGTGCSGSRFLTGNFAIHQELEVTLAEFLKVESALVFSSGFLTNLGALTALCGPNDFVLSDKENHASIVEACRASGAHFVVYRNCDLAHLERQLQRIPLAASKLIVSDGVFSMSGRIAPYDGIFELAKKYQARTYIDDAHALGVIGVGGRGTASHFNLTADIIMGTFSKTLAGQGGFIAGSRDVLDYIRHKARPLIFSVALSPGNVASALAALQIVMTESEHISKLHANALYLKLELDKLGLNTMGSQTPIIPIRISDEMKAFEICRRLLELGVFTTPVIYPAAPRGHALIRCAVMSTHSLSDLDKAIQVFSTVAPIILESNRKPNRRALVDQLNYTESVAS